MPSSRLRPSQSNSISSQVPEPSGRSTLAPGPSLAPVLDGGRRGPNLPKGPRPRPFPDSEVKLRSTPQADWLFRQSQITAPARPPSAIGNAVAPGEPRSLLEGNLGTSVRRGLGRTPKAVKEVEAACPVLEEFLEGYVKFSSIEKDQDRIL